MGNRARKSTAPLTTNGRDLPGVRSARRVTDVRATGSQGTARRGGRKTGPGGCLEPNEPPNWQCPHHRRRRDADEPNWQTALLEVLTSYGYHDDVDDLVD